MIEQKKRVVEVAEDRPWQKDEKNELLGHVQFRSWCKRCVASRGVGQAHRQVLDKRRIVTIPEIVMFCFDCVQRQGRRGSTCSASFTSACPSHVVTPAAQVSQLTFLCLQKGRLAL